MDNQHRKISGYRELDQSEIDLMNEIKEKGKELDALISKVHTFNTFKADPNLVQDAQAFRWESIARTDFQTGLMALTRAVAKPEFF